jgi:hypothetical protein
MLMPMKKHTFPVVGGLSGVGAELGGMHACMHAHGLVSPSVPAIDHEFERSSDPVDSKMGIAGLIWWSGSDLVWWVGVSLSLVR